MFEIMHLGQDITFQLGFQFPDNTMSNLFKVAGTQSTQTIREIKFFPSKKKSYGGPKGKKSNLQITWTSGFGKNALEISLLPKKKKKVKKLCFSFCPIQTEEIARKKTAACTS